MEKHILKITSIVSITHDVHCIRLAKPDNYNFIPGHATEVAVNKPGWEQEKRPFTFTCLNSDPYLEFTIKSYNDHDGVTKQIGKLKAGDELIIHDHWGTIEYAGEGYFIAGGAGITPFIAILRQLYKDNKLGGNKLFFSNKTSTDIIYEKELKEMLGDNVVFVLTDEADDAYFTGRIDETFLKEHIDDFSKQFYVCGPDPMINVINDILTKNGADPKAVVFEK